MALPLQYFPEFHSVTFLDIMTEAKEIILELINFFGTSLPYLLYRHDSTGLE